jgi:hypothetical protein
LYSPQKRKETRKTQLNKVLCGSFFFFIVFIQKEFVIFCRLIKKLKKHIFAFGKSKWREEIGIFSKNLFFNQKDKNKIEIRREIFDVRVNF